MDRTLTTIQDKSIQANENKVIYHCNDVGIVEQKQVTTKYTNVRRIFVSFPEDSLTGFLILTTNRPMLNEGSVLFKTVDGGAAWTEVGPAGPDYIQKAHSLTTGGSFITKDVGFVTIYSLTEPQLWRTEDGGEAWQQVIFADIPEYFTMAYPPKMEEGVRKIYISMEDYSVYGVEKALYTSNDMGLTWEYEGQVLTQ